MVSSLGRGLGSLLGGETVLAVEKEQIREIPLDRIVPNSHQPRKRMEGEALEELAESIRTQGVLQPILVRLQEGSSHGSERYELVAGERRWRACQKAGLTTIPALVREWNDGESLEVAILENVQREELNPVEIAHGYHCLIELFGYSHKKVGKQVGKSRVAVSNTLRLLNLPDAVLSMVSSEALSMGHARALLSLESAGSETLIQMANRTVEEGLSVRALEALLRRYPEEERAEEKHDTTPERAAKGEDEKIHERGKGGRRRDPMVVDLEKKLQNRLKIPVTMTYVKGRGKIILEFDSPEMMESLTTQLLT